MKPEMQELLRRLGLVGERTGHPGDLCVEAAAALRKLLDDRERGWLIETARQTYWNGRHAGSDAAFVPDANEAVRFARFEDAEIVRCWLLEQSQRPARLRSSEHVFLPRTLSSDHQTRGAD